MDPILALLISRLFWDPYWIPSGNMKPALLVNDYIAVTPVSDVQRGDVLVFAHPNKDMDFVKRLVGLPGEEIQMINGVVHIDGAAVVMAYAGTFEEPMERQGTFDIFPLCNVPVAIGETCVKDQWIETLPNGVSYPVLNIRDVPSDNTAVFTVPSGHYFFLGDNRDNSLDSRFADDINGLGFVPKDNIKGRVSRIVLPDWGTRPWWITALTNPRVMDRVH